MIRTYDSTVRRPQTVARRNFADDLAANKSNPPRDKLTLDDLERLAFTYGGTIESSPAGYTLVGAVMDGRTVTLGPVS